MLSYKLSYKLSQLLLIRRARKMAQDYYLMYHENIPTAQLVYRVALVMQVVME